MFYAEDLSNALQMLTLAEVLGSVMNRINRNLFGRTASAQAVPFPDSYKKFQEL